MSPTTATAPGAAVSVPDEPSLDWWGHTWRMALAALPILSSTATLLFAPDADVGGMSVRSRIIDVCVGSVAVGLLWWHRRYPRAVMLALVGAVLIGPASLGAAAVAFASIATRRRAREIAGFFALALAADYGSHYLYRPRAAGAGYLALTAVTGAYLLLAMGVGLYVGGRRAVVARWQERARVAIAEQEAKVAAARSAERTRIAREMHDVLAHRISLLSMHAGVLAFRDDLPRTEIRAEAELIQATASEALGELRGILGLLRATEVPLDDPHREAPQPTIDDLPRLVEEARAAGAEVVLDLDLPAEPAVPATLGRHIHRIAQECLTNARKHAPGAPVRVGLAGSPGAELVLTVENAPARMPRLTLPGSGLGLVGVAERATIVGGSLEHGRTRDGGYLVVVRLPWTVTLGEGE